MDRGQKPEWKALGYSQGIQEVTDRIYKSYQAFFRWAKTRTGPRKSPPKLRPFRKYKSFTLKQAGWNLNQETGEVKIGKNKFRYNKSRDIKGEIKTVTIKRDSVGDWYVIFSCDLGDEYRPEKIKPMTGKNAGFDFGLKTFLKSSDEDEYQSPQPLAKSIKELKRKNRVLSRKTKGSKNRKKARKTIARLHRKIARQRTDFHFKLALQLIDRYDKMFFETLSISAMKKLWGRKVSDLGLYSFLRILEFKASENYRSINYVGRFFPSSKLCSKCGSIKNKGELKLKDRVYKCECGHEMDRDLNAAINILREGASFLGLGGVRPTSVWHLLLEP